ncbi:MAG: hypothetical protein WAU70_04930 [Flavobacteriales bacterium]
MRSFLFQLLTVLLARVEDVPGLVFTSRGKVQAKGMGEMERYFVDRRMHGG